MKNRSVQQILVAVFMLLVLIPAQGFARAKPATENPFEVFVDEFFKQHSASAFLPGAVVAVVKDGRIELLKGYGYADLDTKTPMSPHATAVRVASTSKLFTVTAVMQLVEKGVLDLDADIKTYIPNLDLRSKFNEPVTLRHLLTHTAGLDEVYVNLVAHERRQLMPLSDYIKATMPARIFRPGVSTSYSNHGFALAGYVVEVVTGMPFDQYMQKYVLEPLGMTSSSFDASPQLESRIARGYEVQGGKLGLVPMDYVQTGPASSLVTTAADISHFMISQLEGGRWDGRRILRPDTVEEMQRRQFSNDPRLPGFGLGFFEYFVGGERLISHGGEVRGWNTLFALIPSRRTGVFFCYNRYGPDMGRVFINEFVRTFWPKPEPSPQDHAESRKLGSRKEGEPFKGFFRLNRYPHNSFTAIGALVGGFAPEYFVSYQPGGYLRIFTYPWISPLNSKWFPAGDKLFKASDTGELMAFRAGDPDDVRMKYLFRESMPEGTFQRINWYEALALHMLLMMVTIGVFIFAIARTIVLREKRQWLPTLVSGANLLFLVGLAIFFSQEHPVELAYGVPSFLRCVLTMPMISSVGTALLYGQIISPFVLSVIGGTGRIRAAGMRIGFPVIVGVASVIFLAILHYWNFIGMRV